MTNPGEYLWNIDFGAGLSAFVGQPRSADRVAAIVASQILKEQTVAPFPPPTVTTELLGSNGVVVTIKYHDKSSGIQTNLKLPVQL